MGTFLFDKKHAPQDCFWAERHRADKTQLFGNRSIGQNESFSLSCIFRNVCMFFCCSVRIFVG